jgi:dihydroorotate dehydrogenase
MLYSLLRPLLFRLDAERAHHLTLAALATAHRLGLAGLVAAAPPPCPVRALGLEFANPVGLAAGLDKNGDYIDALGALGFGFLEIGTVTPRPQPGNPHPRLFRLPAADALINRMGFNNLGVDHLVRNVERAKYTGVLGINIGKNFDTPIERAADDYLFCLDKVYAHADYVTINISSPNTKNLRQLQQASELAGLLEALKNRQAQLASQHRRQVPLLLKIAPDLDADQVQEIARLLLEYEFDGVIATNTTLSREGVAQLPHGQETGGLSGRPVFAASTQILQMLSKALQGRLPVIGVGGILSGAQAQAKIAAGASLVQIYTGFIYRGPELIKEICREICQGAS